MTIATVLDLLVCPHCAGPFEPTNDARGVQCDRGHRFDLAKQGYLNLLAGPQPANADTAAMIAARQRFLATGSYDLIGTAAEELAGIGIGTGSRVLDAGAGTGRLLATLLDTATGARGVALDVSTAAARRAAQSHPRLGAVVADVWRTLPVADKSIDLVLSNFAPRNPAEFARVLGPGGQLLTISPTTDHLAELRRTYGLLQIQSDKADRLAESLATRFTGTAADRVEFRTWWPADVVADAIAMGPNAFHTGPDLVTTAIEVTVSVDLRRWQRR